MSSSKADKDKQPSSAPPGTSDDSQRGQQSLLDDIPASFDLSFLAGFDHETSDRDGDDASFAFFSTMFPTTHAHPELQPELEPEPIPTPSMSMPIPATLLSPPLSSEDEMQIQHYLPPQSQDPSLFAICTATSLPLHTSTAFLQGAGGCQCLSAVIFAVEEFEASCRAGNRAELDSITAYQEEVIRRCRSQLKCSGCMARRETLVLLVFMLQKFVAACGRIVALYRVNDTSSSPSLLVNGWPPKNATTGHSVEVKRKEPLVNGNGHCESTKVNVNGLKRKWDNNSTGDDIRMNSTNGVK